MRPWPVARGIWGRGAALTRFVKAALALSAAYAASAPQIDALAETHPPLLENIVSPLGLDGFVTAARLPEPSGDILQTGKTVWAENCENCHGGDRITGAPKITSTKRWKERIARGLPELFAHAQDGFLGPTFKEMPARGGNPELSDAEVQAAVAFMVWASGGAAEVEAWISEQSLSSTGGK